MADTVGQQDLNGLNVDTLAKGFADEALILKNFVTVSSTDAVEIRWWKKTAGYLDSTDTTAITSSQLKDVAFGALPDVVEQSWSRQTSYVKKFFVESPMMADEDIRDSDLDVLATNVRDLVRAVSRQIDIAIYDTLTESLSPSDINTAAATGTGWDDGTNGNPILDLLTAQVNLRTNSYDPMGAILYIHPTDNKNLINWLISTKGSSIPQFSSQKVVTGVVMELLGFRVVVSANATADYALVFADKRACTWKQFSPMKSVVIDFPGIGKKIRAWQEGVSLLTDPKSVHLITDTIT